MKSGFVLAQNTERPKIKVPVLIKGNQFLRVALSAPAVAVAYAAIAYAVVTTGCMPPFADVDFFGVPVTVFLLLALTVAALILIIFAAMNALRVLRVLRRRHRGGESLTRRGLGAAAVLLALMAFVVTAWLGLLFFHSHCV